MDTTKEESGDCPTTQSLICPICGGRVMIIINIKENWTKFYTLTLACESDENQQQKTKFSSSLAKTINESNNNGNCEANPTKDEDCEYTPVKCTSCDKSIGLICKDGRAQLAEETLQNSNMTKNGWVKVDGEQDRVALFVLSQLIYREREPPDESQLEVEFTLPAPTDAVKLLWIDGVASGFFSLKLKGTLNPDTMETYSMTTLDTIFIRKQHRRQGLASAAVQDILAEFPEQNIGFSYPISQPMEKVLSKHLVEGPKGNRLRFWEISGCGTQGNCRNLWLNLQKKRKRSPVHQQ